MQLKEIRNIFHKELGGLYALEEINSFFYLLIEHHLGLERFILALKPDVTITKTEEQPLFEALSELKKFKPIQYIIGETSFMELDFAVNPDVLIPRPETEELVRWIIDDVKAFSGSKTAGEIKILDIGTGSGCIAIALAKNLPQAEVYALDVSESALKMARTNAIKNKVSIQFSHLSILNRPELSDKFDIIVSNPPYVREQEKVGMHSNVLDNEPSLALFVEDDNPLIFYKEIALFAKKHLNESGALYLEINQYLAKETEQLLKEHNFSEIELRKDMFDNDRMIKAVI
ncbi:peptide chain release factor N(5)-glutamine methyltransferase [Pseudozobellia sp. WGM2]|uniref:peptide chain release factor N(5)-glutamine methyltransferase n=1 Tax=Pseudozobellia sp. WGM2 TaxID=2787625 RepID=UPI001AE09A19|nr:peptide chain release factor N(5)-glutamine methyltransferase [Pseudozobellia sp. WGM2]